ncbi:Dam family site-specific DNA-(adenine-N6)-methyltransferase [Mycoplasma sp. Z407A]|uniref:Dam family site-specific DNA-(adenine-N6)-methyltransferase n=1 Tax=Mycoplasma sp. Z407A TaxID=3401678 RepID=UPI003AADFB6B
MIKKIVGNNIKNIRKEKKASQDYIAEVALLDRGQLSKIESGKVNITIETVAKIAQALNVNVSSLFVNSQLNEPKPFVKWAGGKTQILSELKKYIPEKFNTYYEPFLGGGALFFALLPEKAVINDLNMHLMNAFKCFEDETAYHDLIKRLKLHENKNSEQYYYAVREQDREADFWKKSISEIGARLIYLNKACFNGLYRENSSGYFNVPFGKKEKVNCFDLENFNAIFNYFKQSKIKILSTTYQDAIKNAKENDFIYLDPPYDVYPDKTGFVSYGKDGFDAQAQRDLAECFKMLSNKGAYVMLSNHNTPLIQELYQGFNIRVIHAKRMINSKGSGRGAVEEVIITNY